MTESYKKRTIKILIFSNTCTSRETPKTVDVQYMVSQSIALIFLECPGCYMLCWEKCQNHTCISEKSQTQLSVIIGNGLPVSGNSLSIINRCQLHFAENWTVAILNTLQWNALLYYCKRIRGKSSLYQNFFLTEQL